MKPQVQSLASIMAELEPATSKQTNLVEQQRAGLGAKYAGQQTALDATKAQAMNTINTQATGRGMAFSGIPLDEQATYLSTAYLPAVAGLTQQQNAEDLALQGKLADIYSQNYKTAYDVMGNQQSALNAWNMDEMQRQYQAQEAERQRQFTAQQNAADRAATASRYQAENTAPTLDQSMADGFSTAQAASAADNQDWRTNFSTERVLDQLINDYATTPEEVAMIRKKVYDWRRNVYNF